MGATTTDRWVYSYSKAIDESLAMAYFLFFFNATATTEIYTLSLHDALPIFGPARRGGRWVVPENLTVTAMFGEDRKSTRLNSSHRTISYAVFCLKKKKK